MKVLIVAPHADDETLGASIACQAEVASKKKVEILIVTERKRKRNLPPWNNGIATKAMRNFHSGPIFFWNFPDGRLHQHIEKLEMDLKAFLAQRKPKKIYIPAFQHGHLDHDIVSYLVTKIARSKVMWYWLYSIEGLIPQGESMLKGHSSFIANKDRAINVYLGSGYLSEKMEVYKGKNDLITFAGINHHDDQFYKNYNWRGYKKLRRYIENS